MNIYVKNFLRRGLAFGGFGPIVAGIVYMILSFTLEDFSLDGREVFVAIISTYALAFIQAGASVFNQVEDWPIAKSLLIHFATLFIAYSGCYLVNTWIPFEPAVLLIFAAVFVLTYAEVWLTVYFVVRGISRDLNTKIS